MIVYLIIFAVGALGLIALFGFRYAESATGMHAAPRLRARLDARARSIEEWGVHAIGIAEHFPAYLLAFALACLHLFAILIALAARTTERQAHLLAESVSHRRRFERRETRSAFLKQVSAHKEALASEEKHAGQESE